jgi:hypothetical protein
MTWQSSKEMIEAPVEPTVQKKALVQACCGYSVRMFWFQNGFQAKSSAPVKLTIIVALLGAMRQQRMAVGAQRLVGRLSVTGLTDGGDRFNRRFIIFREKSCNG